MFTFFRRGLWVVLGLIVSGANVGLGALPAGEVTPLTLEQIMAHPDWIGQRPEAPYFSADGGHVYFLRKEPGRDVRSLWRVPSAGGAMEKLSVADMAVAESAERIFSADRRRVAWLRGGNLWVRAEGDPEPRQLTRTGEAGALLAFLPGERVAFRSGERVLTAEWATGRLALLATLRVTDDPDEPKEPKGVLAENEARLFDIIKLREQRRLDQAAVAKELAEQPASAPRPIYFGKDHVLRTFSLSPDGQRMIVGVTAEELRGKREKMPAYVNADGYTDTSEVRTKVGTDKPTDETLYLVDLRTGEKRELVTRELPGVVDDPLAELREAAKARKLAKEKAAEAKKAASAGAAPTEEPSLAVAEAKADDAEKQGADAPDEVAVKEEKPEPTPRPVFVHGFGGSGVRWNPAGERVAILFFAYDNKDRWLTEVNWADATVSPVHRLSDPAWVNDTDFNEFGWLPAGDALWFLSEESGYSHLHVARGGQITALTQGKFEVDDVQVDVRDGWFYYRANQGDAGNHEVYRVKFDGSRGSAVTRLGGNNTYELSPDGRRVAVMHGRTTMPPELYAKLTEEGTAPVRLSETVSAEFLKIKWVEPEFVGVASRHGGGAIPARLYRAVGPVEGTRPAVMFVHGAGYLQNVHRGWSQYFREFMFHQLLVQRGYVVLDMDYRGSAGYGRDWRTAIYRQMGTPELHDYLDGAYWLKNQARVDPARIGIYGGSYGGFLTLMALFKEPEVFAAGAALRPVTDWAHYNHGYTSNILNPPELDPEAYARSSPIEFAAGLKRPLLISHGMLDDNVLFQDSVRLVQRLIELKKGMFEVAMFPIEPHGFVEPESWLHQYRRIFQLMERDVKHRAVTDAMPSN